MHHAARLLSLTLVAWMVADWTSPPAAAGPPVLELRRDWYRIVEPFRYEEARRFQRGWNRGAGSAVHDGIVRSPAGGTVRFSGRVAGRGVVTVAARVGGLPAVVTFTGLAPGALRVGDRVRAGDVVGHGSYVHVGAYAVARRTRYLRVAGVDAREHPPTAPSGIPPERPGESRSPLSDAVARRLAAAIAGEVALPGGMAAARPEAPALPRSLPGSAPSGMPSGHRGDASNSRVARLAILPEELREEPELTRQGVLAFLGAPSRQNPYLSACGAKPQRLAYGGDQMVAAACEAAASGGRGGSRAERRAEVRDRVEVPRSAQPPDGISRAVQRNHALAKRPISWRSPEPSPEIRSLHEPLHPLHGIARRNVARSRSAGRASRTATVWTASTAPGTPAGARSATPPPGAPTGAGGRTHQAQRHPVEPTATMPLRDGDRSYHARARRTAAALACALAVCLLVLVRRRRRRAPADARTTIAQPLPPVVPQVQPYAYPVLGSDGSSMLPDVALAWPARDVGTCPDIEPHECVRERAAEHA